VKSVESIAFREVSCKPESVMSTSCIENFFVERNAFVKIISESVNLIKSIYSGKNDVNLDCVMYTWERERLLLIIKDLESMYLKYQDVLFLLPKEESRAEFQYGKKLIRAALDVINSPPARFLMLSSNELLQNLSLCTDMWSPNLLSRQFNKLWFRINRVSFLQVVSKMQLRCAMINVMKFQTLKGI